MKKQFELMNEVLLGYVKQLTSSPEVLVEICSQFENVLRNCDQITYEDVGTAEAYALIHFLDRYHRFQLIFKELDNLNLIVEKQSEYPFDILDVGTGPGPSMFALSDFFASKNNQNFKIDYVERSHQFRNWLHHFTEYANYEVINKHFWNVPYHHGTFHDFKNISFDQHFLMHDIGTDGDNIVRRHTQKHRYDLVVFSNFLTEVSQVKEFESELYGCMKNLRNNGLLVVVGAKATSQKYEKVYSEIDRILLQSNFSNSKFIASCQKVDIDLSLKYLWGDEYGSMLKGVLGAFYDLAKELPDDVFSSKNKRDTSKVISESYNREISWKVVIYKKKARPRK
ncbi:hypothetical protein U2G71_004357 [Vibrio vulnificus]|nr:hypothetical protein [Vibrio vulnificus]